MTASWSTDRPVRRPRVQLGTLEGGFGHTVEAETRTYTDGTSGRTVYTHHARMHDLHPGTTYTYAALHDGGRPDAGTFRTAGRGRQAFTFTSFGDQAVPSTTWQPDGKGGYTVVPSGIASPASADIVAGIENEKLNGPIGFSSFQTRFDLVVCGHEHDYERSHPVHGTVSGSETLTPNPVSTATDVIDTSQGTVHMVLGGGGTSSPTNHKFFAPEKAKVITGVGAVGANGKRTPVYVYEDASWVGVRDLDHSYGFSAFTVDPGTRPGGTTSIHVTYYTVAQPTGEISPLETFVLHRQRSDR